jgi:hypothetical protein
MIHVVSFLEAAVVGAPCEVCRKTIRTGPVYEGRYVEEHDAIVCNHCWDGNRNGWRGEHEEEFLSSSVSRLSIAEMQEQRRQCEEGSSIKVAQAIVSGSVSPNLAVEP